MALHYVSGRWRLIAFGVVAGCTSHPDVVAVDFRDLAVAGSGGSAPAGAGGADGPVGGGAGVAGVAGAGGDSSTTGGGAGEPTIASGGAPTPTTVQTLELTGDLETHDSCVIETDGRFFLFHTGPGIVIKTSDDLHDWRDEGSAFDVNPAWIAERVPEATVLWAPDVSWFGGTYHLYYAASTFGSGLSCIGHATKDTLDSPDPWTDLGPVICSDMNGVDDDWDAIDPSTFADANGIRWMVFGSFGSGIKLIRLDDAGARVGDEFYALAQRPTEIAVQAPYILLRDPYYYLFVSFDFCCRGVDSTYNIRVGRSIDPTGPYVDRDGVSMLEGGGTLLLAGDERWRGVGANTILTTQDRDYNVYHSYDANAAGRSTLRISEVAWDADGWPVSAGP
jgi:arabinan endo-1,5-alpha-L-arabinosidase